MFPDVVTHRGSYSALENSLAAIQKAIDMHYQYIEFDVRLTKDNIPVVMHDSTLSRTSNGKGFVRSKTYAELSRIALDNGERIPRLEEVIDICRGKITMWMHLKTFCGPVAEVVCDTIHRHNITNEVVLSSLSLRDLYYLRSQSPHVQLNILSIFPWFVLKHAISLKALSVQPRHRITHTFVRQAKKHKIKVLTWPITTKKQLQTFLSRGVDMIMTGEDELLSLISRAQKDGKQLLEALLK